MTWLDRRQGMFLRLKLAPRMDHDALDIEAERVTLATRQRFERLSRLRTNLVFPIDRVHRKLRKLPSHSSVSVSSSPSTPS